MTVRDAFVCFQTCQRQVETPLSFQYPFVFLAKIKSNLYASDDIFKGTVASP